MSTTIKRAAILLPLVLVAWVAVMALVMRFSDAAPAAVVLFPSAALIENLPDGTGILTLSRAALTVANGPGTASDLYAAGAWLVLPAGLTGCLPLTQALKQELSARPRS